MTKDSLGFFLTVIHTEKESMNSILETASPIKPVADRFKGVSTLRHRLLISILPAVLLPLAIASAIGYNITERRAKTEVVEKLKANTLMASKTIETFIQDSFQFTDLVAANPMVIEAMKAGNKENQDKQLARQPIDDLEKQFAETKLLITDRSLNNYLQLIVKSGRVAEIFFTERNGLNVAFSNITSDFVQRDEDWWQNSYQKGRDVRSPEFDESANATIIAFSQAVKDPQNEEFLGVIKAGIPATTLIANLANYLDEQHNRSARFQVIDPNNGFVFSNVDFTDIEAGDRDTTTINSNHEPEKPEDVKNSNVEVIGGKPILQAANTMIQVRKNVLSLEKAKQSIGQQIGFSEVSLHQEGIGSGKITIATLRYQDRIYNLSTVPNTELVSIGVIDYDVVASEGRNLLSVFALTGLVLGTVAFVLIIFLAQQLSRPLTELSQKTQEAAAGNLDVQADTKGTLETRILEDNFNKLVSRVKESLQAKSTFIAHMNHELRTPLNGILGFTQILQKDPNLNSQQLDGIKTIHQCGSHLLTIIGDILDLAKIEADKLELEESDWYFSDLLESLIAIIRLKAHNKGIVFHYQPQSSLPTLVQGDQKRLRQVLLNLLSNAVKFTETGSVVLRVGYVEDSKNREDKGDSSQSSEVRVLERVAHGGNPHARPLPSLSKTQQGGTAINNQKIRFEVEDTGIGIPSEKLADIFVPFQQAVEGPFAQAGTGLGLTISQDIVKQMGGEIQVKSVLGQGSVFWFEIDLPTREFTPGTEQTESKPHIIGFKGQARPILIVDDRDYNRAILVKFLTSLGFEVVEAANGQECLAQAKRYQPSLILMDLVMPVLDGFETSRRLRQEPDLKNAVIVAISASIPPQDKAFSYQAGCDAFLSKPIKFEELLETIEAYLKVEWIYEQNNPTTLLTKEAVNQGLNKEDDSKTSSSSLVSPPYEELAILLELAKQGNIARIIERAEFLEHLDAQYQPFAQIIRQLAEGFQEKKLRKFIEEHIKVSSS